MAPSNHTNHTTPAPSPNHTHVPTEAPTKHPTKAPTKPTRAPTKDPTHHPYVPPDDDDEPDHDDYHDKKNPHQHLGFFGMLGRLIAWLILLFLGTLLFGFCMNHRYQIYYVLRGLYYTVLGWSCTRRLLAQLGLRRPSPAESSTILFDNELSEGLLLQENFDD